MSFVGTRPEVTKYVKKYTKEMRANDIDFDKLPNRFVLKCNHNSGLILSFHWLQ